ncbi:MAG TPA: glycolate oxidase iron-sulfur subunit, partial [Pusillimonas sp.]|nr:glycolate oxidase iron-sulfur subunit [Pusillimonas sp.]
RNCETTCPSGVRYHDLLDIGRAEVDSRVARPWHQKLLRLALRKVIPNHVLFSGLLRTGQQLRPILPAFIAQKIPETPPINSETPSGTHTRKAIMLEACVQRSLSPNTRYAATRVLDRLGISAIKTNAGCCGANDMHLGHPETAKQYARKNIDLWWPMIEQGGYPLVHTASGCGAFIKEYDHLLQHDPDYAQKAKRISAVTEDLVETIGREDLSRLHTDSKEKIAVQCPCTLQHAQRLPNAMQTILKTVGFQISPVADSHLCCGSAGTYSITQPQMARTLRDQKMDALEQDQPDVIATANIGCQTHLNSAKRTPVKHWIEIVDAAIQ